MTDTMDVNADRAGNLSPAKQALLAKWLQGDKAAPKITRRPGNGPAPLTFAQQRLWFLAQLEPGNSIAYNIPLGLRMNGALSVPVLTAALHQVVKRHQALQTTFAVVDGRAEQVFAMPEAIHLPVVDLQGLPEADRMPAAMALGTREARFQIDLVNGPLLRPTLVRLDDTDHILIIIIHHIVADAWSLGVFVTDLITWYGAAIAGRDIRLPDLPVRYSDYAHWQRDQAEVLKGQLSYWVKQLEGAPTLDLPVDRPRPPIQTSAGATHAVVMPQAVLDALHDLARATGTTLFMTLLAAFNVLLNRYTSQDDIVVGTPVAGRSHSELQGIIGFFANTLVLRCDLSGDPTFRELLGRVRPMVLGALANQDMPLDYVVDALHLERDLSRNALFQVVFALQNAPRPNPAATTLALSLVDIAGETAKFDLWLSMFESGDGLLTAFEYKTDLFEHDTIVRMAGHLRRILEAIAADPDRRLSELPLLAPAEAEQILTAWNQTGLAYPQDACLPDLVEAQVHRTPEAPAVVFESQSLTYAGLNARANQLAHYLQRLGVGPDVLVGISLERSLDMVVGLLAILKAGGAYVPLDPAYPQERLGYILKEIAGRSTGGPPWVLTRQALAGRFPKGQARLVYLDVEGAAMADAPVHNPSRQAQPDHAAYVIYTSGSTGQPKGVVVTHRNVVSFVAAMDEHFAGRPPGSWLAVTSISFDISVLELLWTLARGFKVVVQGELLDRLAGERPRRAARTRHIDFSLFYFASDERAAGDKYRLLLDGARYADRHGFKSIWTPERHFHAFGGLYPNPSVTSAAIAAITERIQIRAGSVVLPLHNPIRVAEEWSVVDNISKGRVGMAIASGWHADDFVLAPASYKTRKEAMIQGIHDLRRLWRGESISYVGGGGSPVPVHILPRPVQAELPLWITAAGNPETFRQAGELGAGVLTHLLGQRFEDVAEKIALYREAWRAHGHPGEGCVTLMLHTYVGEDLQQVKDTVRVPFTNYLRSSLDLIRNLGQSLGVDINAAGFTQEDMDALLGHAFERYFNTSGLMGTPEMCLEIVERLKETGVDEIGCLIDFGVEAEKVMQGLDLLNEVRLRSLADEQAGPAPDYSIAAQIERHRITHLQCTPSLAGLLLTDAETARALEAVPTLLLGGEALPAALARQLLQSHSRTLFNLYGPTETTIWSTLHRPHPAEASVSIGRPIGNTQLYILDARMRPQPVGVPGDLYIGGLGVTRGYHNRPDLTSEKFVPNPFAVPNGVMGGSRLYRTGDLARYRPDGTVEFLGRTDHQIKLHGFRIELGEIESALRSHPVVRDVVVVARAVGAADKQLVAYVVPHPGQLTSHVELRNYLLEVLPDYMIPRAFVPLAELPRTPNGKIDRRALPEPKDLEPRVRRPFVAPRAGTELRLARLWTEVLRVETIGLHDNFFELGGDSIVSLQLIARARQSGLRFTLNHLFQYQTLGELASVVTAASAGPAAEQGLVTGSMPLMPFPDWFFELSLAEPHHWNQAILFEVPQVLDIPVLEKSVGALLLHHDALRTQFVPAGDTWTQTIHPPVPGVPFSVIDLSALPEALHTPALESATDQLQTSLHLTHGPIVHATFFDMGVSYPGRFYMVAHHLVVDGVSWRILLEDLQTAYVQQSQGQAVRLPPKTTSLKRWAEQLADYAQTDAVVNEAPYWLHAARGAGPRLPLDFPLNADDAPEGTVTFKIAYLDNDETQHLLLSTLPAYRTQINDLLLTAMAHTFIEWAGGESFLFDMEGHGREPLLDHVDLTRTVGWLASFYPIRLELNPGDPLPQSLENVKAQMSKIPGRGVGYGLLRTFNNDPGIRSGLRALPQPEVRFNYLGQFNQVFAEKSPFVASRASIGPTRGLGNKRPYVIEINGGIFGGRLEFAWIYSTALHRRATIERLSNAMVDRLRQFGKLAAQA